MKVGKRTQAYFVGFLIGVAIVSVLMDARRDRSAESNAEESLQWIRIKADLSDLPAEIVTLTGARGYVTGAQQVSEDGEVQLTGYFFANDEDEHFWLVENPGGNTLYNGQELKVVSQPGLEARLMHAGLEHQGHEILKSRPPEYRIGVDVYSAGEWIEALENLESKVNYIARVEWIETGLMN